jgi:hypothetical protein
LLPIAQLLIRAFAGDTDHLTNFTLRNADLYCVPKQRGSASENAAELLQAASAPVTGAN